VRTAHARIPSREAVGPGPLGPLGPLGPMSVGGFGAAEVASVGEGRVVAVVAAAAMATGVGIEGGRGGAVQHGTTFAVRSLSRAAAAWHAACTALARGRAFVAVAKHSF
jgi:hypothetical protein